jgi:hypothetical protein
MPEIVADPPASSCNRRISSLDSRNLNYLDLIPFRLARATRAGASRRKAPAIHAAGRPAFPIPSGACPILRPGR